MRNTGLARFGTSRTSRASCFLATFLVCVVSIRQVRATSSTSYVLLTGANITNGVSGSVDYSFCVSSFAPPELASAPLDAATQSATSVSARFWGAPSALLSSFSVTSSCHSLDLQGNRSVQIYAGPAPTGCSVSMHDSGNTVDVFVSINNSPDSWTVSLPKGPSVRTTASCTAESTVCPLSGSLPCSAVPMAESPAQLTSFMASPYIPNSVQSSSTCQPSTMTGDAISGKELAYGLRATYYRLSACEEPLDSSAAYGLPDFSELSPDPEAPPRCQKALDYQAYNTTWPAGSPPLSESNYIGCFAAQLDGYIRVYNNTDLRDLTSDHPTAYYNRFRVCMRSDSSASLRLNGRLIIASPSDQGFDSVLSCVDTTLPIGWVPIHVEYAGTPQSKISVLQLFVIPVSAVFNIYNAYPLTHGYDMLCDACSVYANYGGTTTGCCLPVGTCSFTSDQCFSPAPVPAPALPPVAAAPEPAAGPTTLPQPAPVPAPGIYGGAPAPSPGTYGGPTPSMPAPSPSVPPPTAAVPAPAYGVPVPAYGAPPPVFQAPAPLYGAPAPAPVYGAPVPAPLYGAPAPAPYGVRPAPYGGPAPEPTRIPAPYGGPLPGTPAPAPERLCSCGEIERLRQAIRESQNFDQLRAMLGM